MNDRERERERERRVGRDNKNRKINIYKKILVPRKITNIQIEKFFKNKNLNELINLSNQPDRKVNEMKNNLPYKPELNDLYRLYQFIYLNKRITVLEFGSGYSSLIISLALNDLRKLYKNKLINLRRNNPFELFIIENEKKFLNITKKRIKNFSKKINLNIKVNYNFSDAEMSLYEYKISTSYKKLPLCNPDFIYLDGPDQFNIKGNINNFSTRHKDMMPMANDILKIEYFLTPGTIIVIDGRGANAQFLRDYLRRNWLYKFDCINDQHIFYLNEKPLGKYNELQLEFYKN